MRAETVFEQRLLAPELLSAALVDRSISAADAIGKTADKIGVGVEALNPQPKARTKPTRMVAMSEVECGIDVSWQAEGRQSPPRRNRRFRSAQLEMCR
jgi:hypothetical protein